jgi:phosphopantothenoylcysteine decarboxylase/phosphopantothenate--cysteine ligase
MTQRDVGPANRPRAGARATGRPGGAVGEDPDRVAGKHVVVTAGATAEAVDPIRILTNRASGKTGRAVARACHVRGADVTLVHDGGEVHYADGLRVESAAEMRDAVLAAVGSGEDGDHAADALVSAAAISDYTVETAPEKLRSGESRTLDLEPTPKLLDGARDAHPDLPIVGFKTETSGDDDAMTDAARDLRDRLNCAFVVANDASVMGADDTRTLIIDDDTEAFSGSKPALGGEVAARLATVLD